MSVFFFYVFFFQCSKPGFYILLYVVLNVREILPPTHCPSSTFSFLPPFFFSPKGSENAVESVPDNRPTYTVRSELTVDVSRSDDNTLITCVVDHASLAPGGKRSEQALRVLCE